MCENVHSSCLMLCVENMSFDNKLAVTQTKHINLAFYIPRLHLHIQQHLKMETKMKYSIS